MVAAMLPIIVVQARADRAFLGRAIRYLVTQEGIRQFLDIGTGLPTADNTHEVAQRVAPEARIVYVDNDPLVLVHARALLTSTPEGACAYVEGDLREPDKILAEAAQTLDLSPASCAHAARCPAPHTRHRPGVRHRAKACRGARAR